MLIARAPLRISLAGGGTDLAAYYSKYGGAVLSSSIDKYFYVFVSLSDSEHLQVSSSDYRTFYRHRVDADPLWDGDLRLPQVIIRHFGVDTGLSVFLASQVPPGTGLGRASIAVASTSGVVMQSATLPAPCTGGSAPRGPPGRRPARHCLQRTDLGGRE